MTKTDGLYVGVSVEIACKHCHRIRVVEEESARADLCHIVCEILENGDRTQCAEDTADAECVAYSLAETVFLRNLKVGNGAGLVKTYLNSVYNEVGTAECILSVLNSEIFRYGCSVLIDAPVEACDHCV